MSRTPMSFFDAQEFFATLYYGEHHIPGCEVKEYGQGWCVNDTGKLATYDFDFLTRLVFLAHDKCVRAEVLPSGPGRVKIAIWKRHKREGSISERHPTIENALADWRKRHPEHVAQIGGAA